MTKKVIAAALSLTSLSIVTPASAGAQQAGQSNTPAKQTISRNGERPSAHGPEQYFTGSVRVDPLFSATQSVPASGAYVTFEPCARSAWHTHPIGQTLIVTSGTGLTQEWGGPIVEIKPGDVIRCPAGIKHWHGAAPTTAMTHLAITGELNGKNVTWMEKVSDEQYLGQPVTKP